MTRRIRLLVAGLTLAAAATTGTALTPLQPAGDTTWGSPAPTEDDSTWDTPPANPDGDGGSGEGEDEGAPARPADTTWG